MKMLILLCAAIFTLSACGSRQSETAPEDQTYTTGGEASDFDQEEGEPPAPDEPY